MPRNKRNMRIRVHGHQKENPDVRHLARAIVRLAVEMDEETAQDLADQLEHQEALRRTALHRANRDKQADSPGELHREAS